MQRLLLSLLLIACGAAAEEKVATFAGGCFWCMEPPYDPLEGVLSTTSGFMGGHVENPTYKQVSRGGTGHAEVVQVRYESEVVSYDQLLEIFWRNIDPYDGDGQFCDRGPEYRPEIFAHGQEQAEAARASREELIESGTLEDRVAVPVTMATTFYPAEDYHQNYYQENPARYKFYRWNCGRDERLEEVWGKSNDRS